MTRNTQKNHRSPDLGALLRAEHVQLDQTFEALAEGFRADPRSAGLIEWKRFEAALLAHLNVEEDLVLPTFQRSHPIEAAQLLDEHASIRRELDELGLGVELHLISVPLIERFISKLRAHAAHIGHPIMGDDKYFHAEPDWDFPGGMQNKLHLHARRIVIPHPSGKGVIDVTAPLPPHMQQSWNLLGFDAERFDEAGEDEE